MTLLPNLRAALAALPDLPVSHQLWLPEALAPTRPPQATQLAALLSPKARLMALPASQPARLGYRLWLTAGLLAHITQNLPPDASDETLLATLTEHLCPDTAWLSQVPDTLPPLAWPDDLTDNNARLRWWGQCARAWLGQWDSARHHTPASRAALHACEQRLGCPLPPLLHAWHQRIGVLHLAEDLHPLDNIEPLLDAFPGITDILERDPHAPQTLALVHELIAFGDYLGNGNQWCFHRHTGQVWYFDHDTSPMLTCLFPQVSDYLDALALKTLLDLHGQADDETLLRQRLGDATIDKWMY